MSERLTAMQAEDGSVGMSVNKYQAQHNSPVCAPLPPLDSGLEELMLWLEGQRPCLGEQMVPATMRVGSAVFTVLGAALDLLAELRAERERLRGLR